MEKNGISFQDLLDSKGNLNISLLNGSDWEDLLIDFDYPSLEVVEPPIQAALVLLFSVTATLSLSGNLTVIVILSLGKRYSLLSF